MAAGGDEKSEQAQSLVTGDLVGLVRTLDFMARAMESQGNWRVLKRVNGCD